MNKPGAQGLVLPAQLPEIGPDTAKIHGYSFFIQLLKYEK